VIFSGTVKAGVGLRAATVPFCAVAFVERLLLWPNPVVDIVRFRASSDSIFFRIAWVQREVELVNANTVIASNEFEMMNKCIKRAHIKPHIQTKMMIQQIRV
jgi:hypothetical protein